MEFAVNKLEAVREKVSTEVSRLESHIAYHRNVDSAEPKVIKNMETTLNKRRKEIAECDDALAVLTA